MPSPSRWGFARRAINVSVPEWVHDAVDEHRRKMDYRSVAEAALELLVAKLFEEGVEPPDDVIVPSGYVGRKRPKR